MVIGSWLGGRMIIPPENLEDIARKFGFGKYAKEKRIIVPITETKKTKYLYIATYETIWRLNTENNELKEITKRNSTVWALCSHNGKLYDGGHYINIFETLNDPEGKNPIATRKSTIYAICSHEGKLYDAGTDYEIFDTLKDSTGKNPTLTKDELITALCSYKGKLYDTGPYGLFETDLTNKQSRKILKMQASSLCDHEGKLYGSNGPMIFALKDDETQEWLEAKREHSINALCSHNGKLYDGGVDKQLFDTSENKVILQMNEIITALASHEEEE